MANNKLLIDERQTILGNFMVGRLLPFRKKRQVGPFTFIDHMGPGVMGAGRYVDVDQHPHIGLCTLTYLFEGEMEHRDSTGTIQRIGPGDVGFMTAGKGVTHTERTPKHKRTGEKFIMHGYQIWVALPAEKEEIEPRFDFYPAASIPQWQIETTQFKLIAGNAFGKSSPLQGHSPLFMVDIQTNDATTINLVDQIKGEVAFVIVKGAIIEENERIKTGQMLISKTNEQCQIHLEKDSRVLLFGGQPLEKEPLLLWNFVSHDRERLEQAKSAWKAKLFPKVPDDNTYIPFPEMKKPKK